jgi:ribose transport system permease protein
METSKTNKVLWKILEVREVGAILPLIIGFLLFSIKSDRFLSSDNMTNVLRIASFTMICSIGECYLLIAGSWDISIGAVYSLGGVAAGLAMTTYGLPIWLSVVIALACGAVVGVFNGFLVQKLDMPAFVATVGTQFMARGLVQGITRGTPVYPLPDAFLSVGQNNLNLIGLAIPWVVVIALLLSIVAALILKYTTYGRKLYAAGGNGEAARLAGIPTSRLRFGAFVLTGVLAALTGVLMASRLGSAQSAVGNGFEMIVIAGAVIGGISMAGGAGSIFGMALGSFFMAMITNGMTLIKISAYWQTLVTGALLVFACSLEYVRNRLKASLNS